MAITTQPELVTAVGEHIASDDLDAFIPDFITMAENWFNFGSSNAPPLRTREMEAIATITLTDGIGSLPADYLQFIRVAESTTTRRNLVFMPSDVADVLYPTRSGGLGNHFNIIGTSIYTFPLVSNPVEMVYYQAIPALTDLAPTNWLLTKAPGLYLRATLIQAYDFMKDKNDEMAKQVTMATALMAGLNRSDMMGKYARAGLTLRGITP